MSGRSVAEPVQYGEWAPDRQGWLFGLTGPSWAGVVATGMPALLAVGAHAWAAAAGWSAVWVLAVVVIAVPVRGRPALRWAAGVVLRGIGAVMGWSVWQSRAATGVAGGPSPGRFP